MCSCKWVLLRFPRLSVSVVPRLFFLLKIMSRWVPHRRAHVLRMARVSCFLFLATFLHPSALLRYVLMMDFEAGFQSLFTEHPLQLPVGQHAANEQAAPLPVAVAGLCFGIKRRIVKLRVGFGHRSRELALHMVLQRVRKRRSNDRTIAQRMYQGLNSAWDKVVSLRHGESAQQLPDQPKPRRASGHARKFHSNKWHFPQSIRLAYRCVGGGETSGKANVIGQTRRTLDALSIHSSIARYSQRMACDAMLKPTRALVIDRRHDATPLLVSFGRLTDDVVGFARYLVRAENSQAWRLVELAEFKKLHGSH